MISTRRAWVLFSNASHTSCMQWVTATTGHCYLITNKRDVPSVRFQKFPAKQTAISASQTLALLSTGGADFVPGFTHHLALQSNFPLSGQASSWSGDNFKQLRWENKRETETGCWHRLLVIHGSLQQMETERLLALWSKVGLFELTNLQEAWTTAASTPCHIYRFSHKSKNCPAVIHIRAATTGIIGQKGRSVSLAE